jgi:hypothetical protein
MSDTLANLSAACWTDIEDIDAVHYEWRCDLRHEKNVPRISTVLTWNTNVPAST